MLPLQNREVTYHVAYKTGRLNIMWPLQNRKVKISCDSTKQEGYISCGITKQGGYISCGPTKQGGYLSCGPTKQGG